MEVLIIQEVLEELIIHSRWQMPSITSLMMTDNSKWLPPMMSFNMTPIQDGITKKMLNIGDKM